MVVLYDAEKIISIYNDKRSKNKTKIKWDKNTITNINYTLSNKDEKRTNNMALVDTCI